MVGGAIAAGGDLFRSKSLDADPCLPEEYTGRWLAKIGIGAGAGLGILLSGWLLFFGNEVPHGYQVLDWSDLEPDPNDKHEAVPATADKLDDPNKKIKIYVRGYILPGRRQMQLKEFSVCRTSDQCRFPNQGQSPHRLDPHRVNRRPHDQLHDAPDWPGRNLPCRSVHGPNGTPYHPRSRLRLSVKIAKNAIVAKAGGGGVAIGVGRQ